MRWRFEETLHLRLFDDLSGDGVAAKLTEFFNGFSAVQNDPTQIGLRDIAVANGIVSPWTISTGQVLTIPNQ